MSKTPRTWLAVPMLWLFFFLALESMVMDSPTMDEQNHLARGAAFVHTGDPRLSVEHPPLVNALSALPLRMMPEARLPLEHPSWTAQQPPDVFWYVFAERFFWEMGNDVTRMIFLGRIQIVFLTMGLALVGCHLAGELWGGLAGITAFFLLLFEPNLLAHGRYITTDVGGTTFLLLATLLLWRLWRAPDWSWGRWLAAALGLGLAFGSKLSTLAFAPIFALLAVLPLYGRSYTPRAAGRRLLAYLGAGLASIIAVWAIFAFQWGPLTFNTAALAFLDGVPGPMPAFWNGIERIFTLTGEGRYAAFMNGRFSTDGFLLYFPFAYLVKTPLPILLALPGAVLWFLARSQTRRRALFLLLPAVLYFALSTQSALNIGYRHLLPMIPFLLILIAGLAGREGILGRSRWGAPALALLLLAELGAVLAIHPHYLSFFNQAAGGPENGYRLLIDSNVDWGQDLLRLGRWMAAEGVEEVNLGWFGTADPAYYDVAARPLPGFPRQPYLGLWRDPPFDPAAPEPGVYALSVSSLWELPLPPDQKRVYRWFRERPPDDRVGYSILIYKVS